MNDVVTNYKDLKISYLEPKEVRNLQNKTIQEKNDFEFFHYANNGQTNQ